MMKSDLWTKMGANPKTLLHAYKAIVRPHLEYEARILEPCNKNLLKQLNKTKS